MRNYARLLKRANIAGPSAIAQQANTPSLPKPAPPEEKQLSLFGGAADDPVATEKRLRQKYREIVGSELANYGTLFGSTLAGRIGLNYAPSAISKGLRLFGAKGAADYLDSGKNQSIFTLPGAIHGATRLLGAGLGVGAGILASKGLGKLGVNNNFIADNIDAMMRGAGSTASKGGAYDAMFKDKDGTKGYSYNNKEIEAYLNRAERYIKQKYTPSNMLMQGIAGTLLGEGASYLLGSSTHPLAILATIAAPSVGSGLYSIGRNALWGVGKDPMPRKWIKPGDDEWESGWTNPKAYSSAIGRAWDYGLTAFTPTKYLWHPYMATATDNRSYNGRPLTPQEIKAEDIRRSMETDEAVRKHIKLHHRINTRVREAGRAVDRGVRAVGRAVDRGARAVGRGAVAVGNAVGRGARAVGRGVRAVGNAYTSPVSQEVAEYRMQR